MKKTLAISLGLILWCASVLGETSTNWYSQSLRKIHFDMHTPGNIPDIGKDFDPDAFAREIKAAGFDAVSFFAKCGYGWSYYPTKIGTMHPHLDYDLFGKGVAAMKKQNLRVIAYYGLAAAPAKVEAAHPEWRLISSTSAAQKRENGGYMFCLFTRFIEDYALPQLEEIVSNYDVDGIFLDNLPNLTDTKCDCSVCLAARKAAGFENLKSTADPAYYRWQLERVQKRCAVIFDTLHKSHPNVRVGINYMSAARHGISLTPPENTGYLTADIVNPGDVFLYSDYELAGWTWRGIPADCMQMRMLTSWADWTTRSSLSRYVEAALAVARGSTYFIGDLLLPQSLALDPEIMASHKQVNDFIGDRASLAGAKSFAEVAVLHNSVICDTEPEKQEYGLGTFTALMDDSQTTQILRDHDLTNALSNYRTLVISHCPVLDEAAMTALEKFVSNGGNLVVSGEIPKENEASFAKLLGVTFREAYPFETSYLFVTNLPFSAALKARMGALPPVVSKISAAHAVPNGARLLAPLTSAGFISEKGLRPPEKATDGVGVSLNRFGRGQAIYCPMSLAAEYWLRGNIEAKYLLQVLTRYVQPAPMVEVKSEVPLDVYTACRDSELLVHLIYRSAEAHPTLPRVDAASPSIHDIELQVRLPARPKSIRLVPSNASLKWEKSGDVYRIKLPPLKTHACCVIQLTGNN